MLGQALVAASRTVEGRQVHSLHAYFLRRGDLSVPIVRSHRSRDGGSFTSRRVVAIQHGQPILTMSASFQIEEPGLDHQASMPVAPPPEELRDLGEIESELLAQAPHKVTGYFRNQRPFEFRAVNPTDYVTRENRPATKLVRFRAGQPHGRTTRRCTAACSPTSRLTTLLATATMPHGVSFFDLQLASIDHAIWFHRDLRVDDWLLYAIDSPSASGARGFSRGSIFTREGKLVASVAQEGLIREHSSWTRPAGQQT